MAATDHPRSTRLPLSGHRSLVVFARAPQLGRVKTRIAAELGASEALAAYVQLAERTVTTALTVRGCECVIAFTPPDELAAMRRWFGEGVDYESQCSGDLGARMAHAIERRVTAGAERVILVGTDCPGLDAPLLEDAFDALERADVVIGPAEDGGYYLIGTRRLHSALFAGIPWGSSRVLGNSLAAARAADLTVHTLRRLADIDTAADWHRWTTAHP
ncbi:MAG: TIGR04282 family arsenosugar biosynthesis glycosyltransferase [Gemmatimonadota bacterium]|nr:TIGR04282 family arsenosugar biosynthesis glycosyltransferase [Gemmatimonadota bacterium]